MDFVPVTPAQKQQFDEQGFLIVRNVLDRDTTSAITEASDRLIASDQTENRQRTNNGLYDGFRNCVSMDDAFMPLLTHPKTFSLVAQLLGPNLGLLTSHLIYRQFTCVLLDHACLILLLFFSSFNFLFSLKVNLGFFITLLSLNDFPLYLFDINFIYFFSGFEISAPVVGSSS